MKAIKLAEPWKVSCVDIETVSYTHLDVYKRQLGGVCGSHHLGQNGSVDGGSAGTAGQAVQLGDVRSHGNRQALGLSLIHIY